MGNTYEKNDQIHTAIGCYEEALELARKRKYRDVEANAYVWLACAYEENNQIQTAIKHYEKALKMATKQRNKKTEIMAQNAIDSLFRMECKFGSMNR